MTFVGLLGGPWRIMGEFCRSIRGLRGGQWVTFVGQLGGPWRIMDDFCGSLGGFLGDNG